MSNRPATPPPLPRWPFVAGDVVLVGLAIFLLVRSGVPPSPVAIAVAALAAAAGAVLLLAPFLIAYEARLRIAEAAARDGADGQARRLTQVAEQLAHAVSRSQSTEEQAGQALGMLEDVAEKLTAHADELAQVLSRNAERGNPGLEAEIERRIGDLDQRWAGMNERLEVLIARLAETQTDARRCAAAIERTETRLDELAKGLAGRPGDAPAAAGPSTAAAEAATPVEKPLYTPATPSHPAETSPEPPSPESGDTSPEASAAGHAANAAAASNDSGSGGSVTDSGSAPASASASAAPQPARTEEASPGEEAPAFALESETTPSSRSGERRRRRESSGAASLVATAYIGIGNKLFLRGEGAGLSWDRGVPMQFLAIGKWGWTATDPGSAITCRIYRNDDTPMLDDNVVIPPGGKVEIAPRF